MHKIEWQDGADDDRADELGSIASGGDEGANHSAKPSIKEDGSNKNNKIYRNAGWGDLGDSENRCDDWVIAENIGNNSDRDNEDENLDNTQSDHRDDFTNNEMLGRNGSENHLGDAVFFFFDNGHHETAANGNHKDKEDERSDNWDDKLAEDIRIFARCGEFLV